MVEFDVPASRPEDPNVQRWVEVMRRGACFVSPRALDELDRGGHVHQAEGQQILARLSSIMLHLTGSERFDDLALGIIKSHCNLFGIHGGPPVAKTGQSVRRGAAYGHGAAPLLFATTGGQHVRQRVMHRRHSQGPGVTQSLDFRG